MGTRSDEPPKDAVWFAELRDRRAEIAKSTMSAKRAFESARRRIRYRRSRKRIAQALAHYWLSLVDTAESIRAIAEQAIRHGVPVRWFDFGEFSQTRAAKGGIPSFPEPLNAVEQPQPPSLGLTLFASLSAINEECLCVYSAPEPVPSRRHILWGLPYGRRPCVFQLVPNATRRAKVASRCDCASSRFREQRGSLWTSQFLDRCTNVDTHRRFGNTTWQDLQEFALVSKSVHALSAERIEISKS